MLSHRLFVFASVVLGVMLGGCANNQDQGVGAYRVSEAVVRSTATNCQAQYKSNAVVGITEDQKSFFAYDSSGNKVFSASPLKRESKGVWKGTDESTHEQYTVIFNNQEDQYLFSVTLAHEQTCVIYQIPKGNGSWSTWADYSASTTQHHFVDVPRSERHDGISAVHDMLPGSGL